MFFKKFCSDIAHVIGNPKLLLFFMDFLEILVSNEERHLSTLTRRVRLQINTQIRYKCQ